MVPNGWTLENFQTLKISTVDGDRGKNYPKKIDYHSEGYSLFLGADNVADGKLNLDKCIFLTKEKHESMGKGIAREDDILLVMRGNGTGRSCIYRGEIKSFQARINSGLVIIRHNKEFTNVEFLHQLFLSPLIQKQFEGYMFGSAQPQLTIQLLKSLRFCIPKLEEQERIAEILSNWDQAISATEKLLENSQQQKKALMQQLLTGKKRLLDETGLRFNIPWEKYRLETFLKEEKQRNKDNSLSRVLSVTNHSGFVLPENQFSKRIASDEVSNYKVVIKGQFGYNPSRINVGSFARLDQFDNGLLSPMYVVFSITSEKLDSDFFLYWMKSNEAKQRINNSTQGSVRDSVGFDAISSFALKLPKIQEQRKIAKVLSLADQEIETLQKKLDYLKQEKKALMQQLLTGKKRVKVAA